MNKNALLVIFGVLAVVLGVYAYFHEGIQRGLKFPGRVGTAADHYFHDGTQLEPGFNYGRITLDDGVWKYVRADTTGQRSYPAWYIIMAQGPERQTFVLETNQASDTPNLGMLATFGMSPAMPTTTSTEFEQKLTQWGFRKTSY